jgi:hypothetical protein
LKQVLYEIERQSLLSLKAGHRGLHAPLLDLFGKRQAGIEKQPVRSSA